MAKVTKKREVKEAAEWAAGEATPMVGFQVAVDLGEGAGHQLHLDFALDAKPKKRIELPVPNSDDTVVIVPEPGNTFAQQVREDDAATRCIVTLGKRRWLADYWLEAAGARIEDRGL